MEHRTGSTDLHAYTTHRRVLFHSLPYRIPGKMIIAAATRPNIGPGGTGLFTYANYRAIAHRYSVSFRLMISHFVSS
ncbi:MAG: hypothetical protein U9R46_09060 [Bacteroidota bacterium]|nr:hypothetical protein [Bacteroidota bacterium]